MVIDAEFSHWLLLCTILLALFLTLGKRRHELVALEAGAADHRPILSEYSPQLLDQMIAVVTASTLMAYALYTMAPETQARLGTTLLPLTIPFVLYGIFRYLYLLYRRDLGGNPSEHLLTDRALLIDIACWGGAVVAHPLRGIRLTPSGPTRRRTTRGGGLIGAPPREGRREDARASFPPGLRVIGGRAAPGRAPSAAVGGPAGRGW